MLQEKLQNYIKLKVLVSFIDLHDLIYLKLLNKDHKVSFQG